MTQETFPASERFDPDRFIVVARPGRSTPIHRQFQPDTLHELTGKPSTAIPTTVDPRFYQDVIHQISEPGDMIIAIGGDGIAHHVGKTILEMSEDKAAQTPFLPLWGGTANDIAHMLNEPKYYQQPLRILGDGRTADIWPLSTTFEHSDKATIRDIALGYVSFGLSAHIAQLLNSDCHRSGRIRSIVPGDLGIRLQELMTTTRGILHRDTFVAAIDKTPDAGEFVTRQLVDHGFSAGWRMARHFKFPSKLHEKAFFEAIIQSGLAVNISRLLLGIPAGNMIEHSSFVVMTPTLVEHDGEVSQVAVNTTVDISTSKRPLKVVTTRYAR